MYLIYMKTFIIYMEKIIQLLRVECDLFSIMTMHNHSIKFGASVILHTK